MITTDIPELLEKAQQKLRIGWYEDALALYDKVLSIDSNNFTALVNKGKAFYYLGRHGDAIVWYDRAITINPNDASLWYERGYTLRKIQH